MVVNGTWLTQRSRRSKTRYHILPEQVFLAGTDAEETAPTFANSRAWADGRIDRQLHVTSNPLTSNGRARREEVTKRRPTASHQLPACPRHHGHPVVHLTRSDTPRRRQRPVRISRWLAGGRDSDFGVASSRSPGVA